MTNRSTIPKVIHYCWFGNNPKNKLIQSCIDSWKTICPSYKIIEWNESNIDIASLSSYARKAYEDKKWAFVADYVRFLVLYESGGIYLDTDMALVKSLDPLLGNSCFFGYISKDQINGVSIGAGIIGAERHHEFIENVIAKYDSLDQFELITEVIPRIYSTSDAKLLEKVTVYSANHFYPLPFQRRKDNYTKYITPETYAVHLWDYSWEHPTARFLRAIHLLEPISGLLDRLRLKILIKKLFNMV